MTNSFSLNIQKGQGLTQALQSYVKSNKDYDISGGSIDKTEWNATIAELGKIQEERKANNKTSIFTKQSGNNMIVKQGQVDLSEDEMNRLLSKMGVSKKAAPAVQVSADKTKSNSGGIQTNPTPEKTSAFDKFGAECADSIDPEKTTADKMVYSKDVKDFDMVGDDFRKDITDNGGKNAGEIYKKKALETADSEIALYDDNHDGMISKEEQVKHDEEDYEKKFGKTDVTTQNENQKVSLRTNMFMDLNKDGKVDDKEFAAYLYAMDSNNTNHSANGKITRDELEKTGGYTSAPLTQEAGTFRGTMRACYKKIFGFDPAEKK